MNLDWRKFVLYAAVIGIEGCWLYALLSLLNRQVVAESLSVFGILLVYLISFGLNGLLRLLRWHYLVIRIINWLGWAVAVLLVLKVQLYGGLAWSDTNWLMALPRAFADIIYTFRPELLILIGTAAVWWLGRRLARVQVNFGTLVTEFQFGLFLLIIAFFSASMVDASLDHPVLLAMVFFLISLLGISLAHSMENTTWLSGLYRGHWSVLLLASIALVLLLGFVISLLVTPDVLGAIVSAIKWFFSMIIAAFLFVAEWIASLFPDIDRTEPMPEFPALPPAGEAPSGSTMSETVKNILRILWTIMIAALCLFALWRISAAMYKWLRRRLASASGAKYEPMPGAFRADLLAFLKRVFAWLLGARRLFGRRPGAAPPRPEVNTVRQIYRQLLRWAAGLGLPRHISQTPYEYQYRLAEALAEVEDDIDLITRQYVRTRYSRVPLTEDELQKLKQSWYNVRQSRPGSNKAGDKAGRDPGGNIKWLM
jgi:hypothetical protein